MKRPKDEVAQVPLANMIDITFLLLMFFIVTAAAQSESIDRQVNLAKSTYTKPPDEPDLHQIIINVRLTPDGQGVIYSLGGREYTLDGIERVLSFAKVDDPDLPIVIRASELVKYKEIEKVTAVLGKIGLYKVAHSSDSEWKP